MELDAIQSLDALKAAKAEILASFHSAAQIYLAAPKEQSFEDLRVALLGRKGSVTALLHALRTLPKEQKPEGGKILNELRTQVEGELVKLKEAYIQAEISAALNAQPIDPSLPVPTAANLGSLHPVSLIKQILYRSFSKLGFTLYEGPEVDLDFYNFGALNFEDDHPARDMQDTFFLRDFGKTVMRTHTTNTEIHTMLQVKPPIRGFSMGRCYRADSDLTHTPCFHQVEGFVVDQHISMSHMKGLIDYFLRDIYGPEIKTRLRPSYFPFVEPGAEVDLTCLVCNGSGCKTCKHTGWLEIGGLGMLHPNVFEAVGIDSERYSGFAFGFGIDRMAMLKWGLPDLRQLFHGDQVFLNPFPIHI